jgi:hypothetical protein
MNAKEQYGSIAVKGAMKSAVKCLVVQYAILKGEDEIANENSGIPFCGPSLPITKVVLVIFPLSAPRFL